MEGLAYAGPFTFQGATMVQLYKTTELEAVNIMLSAIGEAPVSSLADTSLEDVTVAKNILNETIVDVQSTSYNFNSEYNYQLTPDADGNINVPANTVYIKASNRGSTPNVDVILRGEKVYDRKDQTFTFTGKIYVDISFILEWDDLPQYARRYIAIKSARRFQNRVFGSDSLHGFTLIDENEALTQMEQNDSRTEDANILTRSNDIYKIILRNGFRRYNL